LTERFEVPFGVTSEKVELVSLKGKIIKVGTLKVIGS
jgi:hypothetical protein